MPIFYSPSSSIIVTVEWLGLPISILSGSENESITRVKFSLLSDILSLVIGTLNEAAVTPALNMTKYGPES